jgi:2-polyprenyl-3-methyl-5-hydroxy-6-metoxy-1,4-benzoquinol methylase
MTSISPSTSTKDAEYAERLTRHSGVWWKRLLDVQRPYRMHLQAMKLGFVLDIGCGLGRNLVNLGGAGVGVDHNEESVRRARAQGLTAFTVDEFRASPYAQEGRFDALLLAHVVEHMPRAEAVALVQSYLPYVRREGRVVIITPQEVGYRSDPTHVEFVDEAALRAIAAAARLETLATYSFPFPRSVGRVFKYNEFVLLARR